MAGPDIRDLAQEKLPTGKFPAARQASYRVFFAPEVHEAIHRHAGENKQVEICGVVVGTWERDDDGPFARITNAIRCDQATQKFAEVTFTHDSWNHINTEMDTKYSDKRIIGWYHTHPDFGIFLSDRDGFIHQNFFGAPGQIALVVDPVRQLEGIFEWHDGRTSLVPHYWVGDRLIYSSAATTATREEGSSKVGAMTSASMMPDERFVGRRESWLTLTTTVLAWVCMFLLGYLLSGWGRREESRMQQLGAVAHYGLLKIRTMGLEEAMDESKARMLTANAEVKELSEAHIAAAGDKADETRKKWRSVREHLIKTQRMLELMSERYTLSNDERMLLNQIIAHKQAELLGVDERGQMLPGIQLPKTNEKSSSNDKSKSDTKSSTSAAKTTNKTEPTKPKREIGPEPLK